jgi:hypothetical protein
MNTVHMLVERGGQGSTMTMVSPCCKWHCRRHARDGGSAAYGEEGVRGGSDNQRSVGEGDLQKIGAGGVRSQMQIRKGDSQGKGHHGVGVCMR